MSTDPFPTPWVVQVAAYDGETGRDAHGQPIRKWAPPQPLAVIGWHDTATSEPVLVGHDRTVIDRQLLTLPQPPIGPLDQITFPDGTFQVEGHPLDYTHGPFGFRPGCVVNCTRVEG